MRTAANKSLLKNTAGKRRETSKYVSPIPAGINPLQQKSLCPCDGGCPRCAAESRGVTPGLQQGIQSLGSGQPLSAESRAFLEPRFGRDFSRVRVHTGDNAAEAAKSIGAKAFTTGKDVVFGAGQYSPGTPPGKRLLSHELTHCLQQGFTGGHLQRELLVGPPEDPRDPMNKLTLVQRNKMVRKLVKKLGNGFDVYGYSAPGGISGIVSSGPAGCSFPVGMASFGKAVGNCCLCILTRPGAKKWTIRPVQDRYASTTFGTGTINIQVGNSPVRYGYWTKNDMRRMYLPVIVFGHELCGHAALHEVKSHPTGERVGGTRHDPTIKVEHAIWGEQGLPKKQRRGLASSPVHRGESFARIEVSGFPFADSDPNRLPAVEKQKLRSAAKLAFIGKKKPPPDYIVSNKWVDIVGHDDRPGPSPWAKQWISERRAQNVRRYMNRKLGVPLTIGVDKKFVPVRFHSDVDKIVTRFTTTKGVSDSQCRSAGRNPKCRKVVIFVAALPAGAARPVSETPRGPATLKPSNYKKPAAARRSYATGDACARLLIEMAWPNKKRRKKRKRGTFRK